MLICIRKKWFSLDPLLFVYILILILLISISSICSGMETALSSANVIRLKQLAKKGNKSARKAYKLIKNFSRTLSTILIFNNLVNILSTSLATYLFSSMFGSVGVLYSTIIMTIIILVFGEISPKIMAKENAEKISLVLAPSFYALVKIMSPVNKLVEKLENLFKKKKKKVTATEDELLEIVQTIELEGVLNQAESELIQNAVEFDDKRVRDVMVLKDDVIYLYDTSDENTIKDAIIKQKYSRIPIVCENTGKVIGIIHEGDLIDDILSGKNISIRSLIKDAIYVTKNRKLSYALEKIQKSRMHMAIVIDNNEDHNFLGILTLEDIIEELVGEIYDEYDDLPNNVLEIGLHTFQVNPNIEVKYFFNHYLKDIEVPDIEAKTFAGWIKEMNEAKIRRNQEFTYKNVKIKVLAVDNSNIPTKLEIAFTSVYEEV